MVNKPQQINKLFLKVKHLIEEARLAIAVTVNSRITTLYWNIEEHINKEILGNKRAEYGKEIVISLSRKLTEEYGKGWSEKQLRHCLRFAETFSNKEIA